ncbi:MAG TPA: hypothetical protein VGF95_09235 [Solirubrobacteraceae bacterium]
MSPSASKQASARVQAVFELRGESRERVAAAAGEIVHALQQIAALPDCDCDLDVSLDVAAEDGG